MRQGLTHRLCSSSLCLSLLALAAVSCIQREPQCVPAGASGAPPAPASDLGNGVDLLAARGAAAFEAQGDTAKVQLKSVSVEGQSFTQALRADVQQPSGSEWSVQAQAKTATSVKKGDALLATFFVRSIKPQSSGIAETSFVFERAGAPYTKSVTYPLRLTPEWRKVQVRFLSGEDYAAGGAQIIFRLGYEQQTFEVGGIVVENFGNVRIAALPTTEMADRKLEAAPGPAEAPLVITEGGDLKVEVNPLKVIRAISPYVYGINAQNLGSTKATVRRLGGNRGSVYNWELNASNAGHDWRHVNDDWPCTTMGYKNCNEPGAQYASFVQENRTAGVDSIVTIPMLDYVSADKNQDVKEDEKAPSKRFAKSLPKKPGPLSLTPDLKDGVVYQDEFVNFLVSKLGRADKGGSRFYSLDNEPALWPSTHPRVHPDRTKYRELIARSEATASAITKLDPSAFVLGGVMFGWSEYQSLSDAPDHAEFDAKYGNYLEYFLAAAKELEQKNGRRLIHALDVHWYPEAKGTKRITEDDSSRKTIDARLQAVRSLWDSSFVEKSWITDKLAGKPIRLVPWLLETIAKRYPGTKLALTEYNFGAGNHVSGGLAQADVLGVLGREGVYLANYWGNGAGVGDLNTYIGAAFKLYRNFDGNGGSFGDTAVLATVADSNTASVFAATDSKRPDRLTLIIINKDQQKIFKGKVSLGGGARFSRAKTYTLDASGAEIKAGAVLDVKDNRVEPVLKPLSATLLVFEKG